jgi:glycine/D-amino acid oxidase-like deaminating enzyme
MPAQARSRRCSSVADVCSRASRTGASTPLKACFYTVTDDERFVVEKQGAKGWVMSPCSGHGFKFGAVMGLELARTIVAGRDPAAHARWAAGLEGDRPT